MKRFLAILLLFASFACAFAQPAPGLTHGQGDARYAQRYITPANRNVALLGDSRCARAISTSGSAITYENSIFINWLRFWTNQSFYFDQNYNYGVSGDTTEDTLARTDAALAACNAGTWVVLVGINDRGSSWTAARSETAMASIISKIHNAGRICIIIAETPKGSTDFATYYNATQASYVADYKRWLNLQSATPGVYVIDPWPGLVDVAAANASFLNTYTVDAVHPGPKAGWTTALAMLPLFQHLFPSPTQLILPQDNTDVYDATYNPYGVYNSNPMMIGTGGTAGTGGSGSVATGYTGANSSGAALVTRTYSKVSSTATNGISTAWQQVVLTGTPTGSTPTVDALKVVSLQSNFATGDNIEAFARIQWDASPTGIYGITMRLRFIASGSTFAEWKDMDGYTEAFVIPSTANEGVLYIPNVTVPNMSTVTDVQLIIYVQAIQNSAISATIRVTNMGVRKVRPVGS
jgi:hypothetical protein